MDAATAVAIAEHGRERALEWFALVPEFHRPDEDVKRLFAGGVPCRVACSSRLQQLFRRSSLARDLFVAVERLQNLDGFCGVRDEGRCCRNRIQAMRGRSDVMRHVDILHGDGRQDIVRQVAPLEYSPG